MSGPTPLGPFTVRIRTDRPITKIWWASPDESSAHAASAPVERHGAEVTVALPGLKYWMLILIEWEH